MAPPLFGCGHELSTESVAGKGGIHRYLVEMRAGVYPVGQDKGHRTVIVIGGHQQPSVTNGWSKLLDRRQLTVGDLRHIDMAKQVARPRLDGDDG